MMNYDVVGNADRPTLMLLHGFMSSNVQWELNIERLGARMQLVLVELMGHGSSPAPTEIEPYGRAAVLNNLEAIRTELGLERWWVGGHSLGGATAIRYAIAHHTRVDGVVFTNTRAAFGNTQNSREVVSEVAASTQEMRELRFHPIHAKRFPEATKARMVDAADRIKPHALTNTVAHRHEWASAMDLHQLVMPVLLINGRFERRFQPYIELAKHTVSNFELVNLEGGHSINVEQPEAFDAAVLDFVLRDRTAEVNASATLHWADAWVE